MQQNQQTECFYEAQHRRGHDGTSRVSSSIADALVEAVIPPGFHGNVSVKEKWIREINEAEVRGRRGEKATALDLVCVSHSLEFLCLVPTQEDFREEEDLLQSS